ncbi:hypothetical protein HanRHA438_Chr15g0701361 [Helianthus annuus]|uniref:Wall-associated receptor kinase, galacturonan-binding domain-containing protein n=1 Tax=Helianthus annuus TaxID=4232 RepID=A0A9K3E0V6_HELAN|nr:hypothetical protein HanXRQr2_Chr15g0688991 [Helianthus annuus]KAJ0450886.1 putative LEAF RUST 10 DISEASE-RESISTANCE LOCUS RECEPTOR-LIKE PROTEIN KINASE-like 1.1/1.2/1.3/1.4 [Helianthus annuus]KAJ0455223.1 hypothetical protein HanIR_Chr15g0748771 [Helianthus annuus]KAJ0472746.1 putative LEAF RUST 10 DISEASE-RESISTANCE LOCUS RECEPTOR-LIKE PROTEIN KINASE-like 1.1/1.2/1.3/1.4 [Helianthus annuus]KAJ0648353.1 putative LEAF RUST 10 DISEASE-RESISTANCE LOCUS RECEPTOR-LIKE PROTEIN KINASE-like 1.1/1.2/
MILVFVFVSCLPLVHSATYSNLSMPICPESFSCPGLVPFKYPFYNVSDTRCGLIKVNCTSQGGEIQLGGRSYDIGSNVFSDNVVIWNRTFEPLVNTFTFLSPNPLLYSISINPNITLLKCTKNLPYFDQHSYNSYKRCKDHNFYYNYFNGTVPSDLPHTCQLVQLPKKLSLNPGLDETNIFSLLSSNTSIFFNLSHSCTECQTKGLLCDTENGRDVQCYEVKKGIYSFVFSFPSSFIFTLYWVDETNILFGCYKKPGGESTSITHRGNLHLLFYLLLLDINIVYNRVDVSNKVLKLLMSYD